MPACSDQIVPLRSAVLKTKPMERMNCGHCSAHGVGDFGVAGELVDG